MKVFCSGSCRLLSTIKNTDDIIAIHSLEDPHFKGINFLGKFHDTKSHIQFIKFIKGDIKLDNENLKRFFTAYNSEKWKKIRYFEELTTIPEKIKRLSEEIDSCDVYIFEICSIKTYFYNGSYCQFEQEDNNDISKYNVCIQDKEEILEDLYTIKNFFPGKKIIFQCHFRPNIIYDDETRAIVKREVIYNSLNKFCKENDNCFLYDPSIILKENHSLFDGDSHFNNSGFIKSFKFLYNNFLTINKST